MKTSGATVMVANAAMDQNNVVEIVDQCPLCCGSSFRQLPIPGRWTGREVFSRGAASFGLRRCQDCSLAFVNPRPSPQLLDEFYGRDSYPCHDAEGGDAKTAQFLLDCVDRHGPYSGKQFLDFGCGGGFLLRAAERREWNPVGYEVGQRALDSCHAQGLTSTDNLADLTSFSFDVVLLNHVFEHVAQPRGILHQCRRLLDKSGKLFVIVPNLAGMRARLALPVLSRIFNVDERYRAFPSHLFYYTASTLTQTLEKNGFRVLAVETFGLGIDVFFNVANRTSNSSHGAKTGGAETGAAKMVGITKVGTTRSRTNSTSTRPALDFKQIVKDKLFGAGLGESLLAVARPI